MRFDLARLRRKLQLNQKELAEKLGIKQSFLSAIETGKSPLPMEKRLLLAKLCEPETLDAYIIPDDNREQSLPVHGDSFVTETNMLKELLNYFHTQAHRDQDKHHENMHLQIDSYQQRNDRLQERNDELTEKLASLNELVEKLREELHATRMENLQLKEILLSHHIPYSSTTTM